MHWTLSTAGAIARRSALSCACLAALCALSSISSADGDEARTRPDRYDLSVRSETYGELFRRALLPGPTGAIVETQTALPVYQYVFVGAHDVDTRWHDDAVDVELAAWGRAWLGEEGPERRFDGDVATAHARYHHGPLSLRLGRQLAAGGAARYTRFDGVTLGVALGRSGLEAEGYGGFTALPRWDARPGYHHLGAAADSLLRDSRAVPQPERSGYRLVGGRLGWTGARGRVGVSFHDQLEPLGLSRRTFGLDGRAFVVKGLAVGSNALFELDALRVQDARLWADVTPADALDLSVEILHAEPALFLSRQSVLSVFSTDAYEEVGGSAVVHVTDRVAVDGGGWVQVYDEARRGARGEVGVRVAPGSGARTIVRTAVARVLAVDNGYSCLRASLSRRLLPTLSVTLDFYGYLYDSAIRDRITSSVYGGTLSYQATDALNILWGASVAQSPYADFDAQTLVRASLAFGRSTWSGVR